MTPNIDQVCNDDPEGEEEELQGQQQNEVAGQERQQQNESEEGRQEEEEEDEERGREVSDAYMDLLATHLLDSLYKQKHLETIVRGRRWEVSCDPDAGTNRYAHIGFGGEDFFPCEILGSESFVSQTWLWSNANDSVRNDMKQLTMELRRRLSDTVPEFANDQPSMGTVVAHELGVIACGVLRLPAYYCGPNGNFGRIVYLLKDDPKFPKIETTTTNVGRLVDCLLIANEMAVVETNVPRLETFFFKYGGTGPIPDRSNDTEKVYTFPPVPGQPAGANEVTVVCDEDGDIMEVRTMVEEDVADVDDGKEEGDEEKNEDDEKDGDGGNEDDTTEKEDDDDNNNTNNTNSNNNNISNDNSHTRVKKKTKEGS